VRSLEINLKYLSHDWHVQPVVKDPIAFSALGGALGEQRPSFTLDRLSSKPLWQYRWKLFRRRNRKPMRHLKCPIGQSDWLEECFALHLKFRGARDTADFSRSAAIIRASAKSHSFKLKIV